MVHAIAKGELAELNAVPSVRPVSGSLFQAILENIRDYGAQLTELPDATWESSVCQWMEGHWEVLVDLFSEEEGPSDLVLDVRVHETLSDYAFEIHLVYVP